MIHPLRLIAISWLAAGSCFAQVGGNPTRANAPRSDGQASANVDAVSIVRGIPFSKSDSSLKLDLYSPANATDPVPCVIVIQGGGFLPQDGKRMKRTAERLARNGMAAATISYRGRPTHQHRQTMDDVFASVRFIREHCKKYGIDPNNLGATGPSAGGTLTALLATTGKEVTRIQAAVCFAGVFDFVGRFTHKEQLAIQPNHTTKRRTNGEWIGADFAPSNEDWLAASAITHVDSSDPPVLFLHSRDDATVPWHQSRDMHASMIAADVPSEIVIYETGGHGVRPIDADPLDCMVTFFQKHLVVAKKDSATKNPSTSSTP